MTTTGPSSARSGVLPILVTLALLAFASNGWSWMQVSEAERESDALDADADPPRGVPPGHGITGSIVDADGRPIVGARVHLMLPEGAWDDLMIDVEMSYDNDHGRSFALLPTAFSDEGGRFDLDHWTYLDADPKAADGTVLMLVAAPGCITRFVRARPDAVLGVPEIVLQAASTIRGRFLDGEHDPLAGVHVCVEVEWRDDLPQWDDDVHGLNELLQMSSCTASDADGFFVVDGLGPGSVILKVERPMGKSMWIEDVPLRAGRTKRLGDRILPGGSPIAGRIVDADGRPVSGAVVLLVPHEGQPLEWARSSLPWELDALRGDVEHPSTTTDADGRFSVSGLTCAHASLLVFADDFEPAAREGLRPGDEAVHVALDAPARLLVSVGDAATGEPLRDARVRATRHPGYESWIDEAPRTLPTWRGEEAMRRLGRVDPGRGQVLVEGLGLLENALEVTAPGRERRVLRWLGSDPATLEELDVRLGVGASVSGVVRDVEGRPIFDAHVDAARVGADERSKWLPDTLWTDVDGRFAFDALTPGTWDVRARSGRDVRAVQFELAADDHIERDLVIVRRGELVEPTTATLRGSLLTPSGAPLAGRVVELWRSTSPDGSSKREVLTDAAGGFAFEALPASEQRVSALGVTRTVALREGEEAYVVLEVPERATLVGRMVRDGQGVPGEASLLELDATSGRPTGRVASTARSASDGRFLIDHPVGGRFVLRAVDRSGSARGEVLVSLVRSSETRQDVILRGGTSVVRGRLVDAHSGEALAHARVVLRGERMLSAVASVTTDDDGRFAFADVLAGSARLEASLGAWRGTFAVDVPEVGAADVVLRVLPHASLAGSVRREQDRPEGPIAVRAVSLDDLAPFGVAGVFTTVTVVDRFVFDRLPVGRYRIETEAWDAREERLVPLPEHLRARMPIVTVGVSRGLRVGLVAPTLR